jgi:hypothetical protein
LITFDKLIILFYINFEETTSKMHQGTKHFGNLSAAHVDTEIDGFKVLFLVCGLLLVIHIYYKTKAKIEKCKMF